MRLIKFKRASWVAVMAMLALPGAMITSCSKENPTENVVPKGDKLTISVLGINDGNEDSGNKAKASTARSSFAQAAADYKVYEFADADMAVSLGNTLPVKKAKHTISSRTHSGLANSGMKAAEEMGAGVKYVVYIYDGTTLAGSAELESGTVGTIEGLDMNGEYSWVAVSYNSDASAPGLAPADGVIDLPENTDVLLASGTVNLAENPNIEILFNHALARIGIELNTIGVFGNMTGAASVSVTGASLATGTLDVLTGEITAGDAYEPTLTYEDFQNVDPAYDDVKIAYLYTAAENNQSLDVSVQGLEVSHVDGGVSRTYFQDGATFETDVTPEAGKNHLVQLNVVESAIGSAGGVSWGRSNLYYRGDNGGLRDYAFYAVNESKSRADGYFSYGGTIPFQFPTEATSGDPCTLVYPEGLWRQPTDAQINNLTSSQGLLSDVLGLIGSLLGAADPAPGSTVGADYVEYATTTDDSPVFDDASNNLRFYYNGQITNASLLSAIGSDGEGLLGLGLSDLSVDLAGNTLLDLGLEGSGIGLPVLQLPILGNSYGDQAAFWSRTGAINIPILASVGSWGYAAFTTQRAVLGVPFGPEFVKATTTAELLSNIDLLGIDLLNTSLKNVRCVRN